MHNSITQRANSIRYASMPMRCIVLAPRAPKCMGSQMQPCPLNTVHAAASTTEHHHTDPLPQTRCILSSKFCAFSAEHSAFSDKHSLCTPSRTHCPQLCVQPCVFLHTAASTAVSSAASSQRAPPQQSGGFSGLCTGTSHWFYSELVRVAARLPPRSRRPQHNACNACNACTAQHDTAARPAALPQAGFGSSPLQSSPACLVLACMRCMLVHACGACWCG